MLDVQASKLSGADTAPGGVWSEEVADDVTDQPALAPRNKDERRLLGKERPKVVGSVGAGPGEIDAGVMNSRILLEQERLETDKLGDVRKVSTVDLIPAGIIRGRTISR